MLRNYLFLLKISNNILLKKLRTITLEGISTLKTNKHVKRFKCVLFSFFFFFVGDREDKGCLSSLSLLLILIILLLVIFLFVIKDVDIFKISLINRIGVTK